MRVAASQPPPWPDRALAQNAGHADPALAEDRYPPFCKHWSRLRARIEATSAAIVKGGVTPALLLTRLFTSCGRRRGCVCPTAIARSSSQASTSCLVGGPGGSVAPRRALPDVGLEQHSPDRDETAGHRRRDPEECLADPRLLDLRDVAGALVAGRSRLDLVCGAANISSPLPTASLRADVENVSVRRPVKLSRWCARGSRRRCNADRTRAPSRRSTGSSLGVAFGSSEGAASRRTGSTSCASCSMTSHPSASWARTSNWRELSGCRGSGSPTRNCPGGANGCRWRPSRASEI
jgi:hypothetical protein